ncbi:MAG: cold shock domain-containing protein [Acidimicrobiales bacterium]|nr:cold shock domain-containing protein [Acidimicrobiales bacterium]
MNAHSSRARRIGRVTGYDDAAAYGTVTDGDGEWFFHCTAIADGSRTIEPGAEVGFVLVPGHRGRLEARDIAAV